MLRFLGSTLAVRVRNSRLYFMLRRGRIKYWPCRRGVHTPTNLTDDIIKKSGELPRSGLSLEFVYGYGGINNTMPNLFYNKDSQIVYYTAAVRE